MPARGRGRAHEDELHTCAMQVGGWLGGAGLGEHAAAFKANHIDGAALVLQQ